MLRIFTLLIFMFCVAEAVAFDTDAKYAILIDYDTKSILFEKEAKTHMAPSSMSKMMTAYIAFESLKNGSVSLTDEFMISEKAWRMGGTRMFIPLKMPVTFEELLKGLIIISGNDAAVAIAEALAGSEDEFAERMNETAAKLGMKDSHFTNATGWPDENNYSCAYDLALLAIHTIQDFPEYYHYYAETEFTFNKIKQGNRNGLLYRNMGADGLKTGHAEEAGFGLTASVKKHNRRLIAVVNGLKSNKERTAATENLMNYGLVNFTNLKILNKNESTEKIQVKGGNVKEIDLISAQDIILTLPKKDSKNVKIKVHYHAPVVAPIKEKQELGELIVETPAETQKYPLVSAMAVHKGSFVTRIKENLSNFFR